MNKKGQVLVMFLLVLPLLIGVMAFVVDVGLITYEKTKLTNIIKSSNKNNIEKNLRLNKIENYNINKNNMCIKVTYKKDSIFGTIIGIKEYKIAARVCEE